MDDVSTTLTASVKNKNGVVDGWKKEDMLPEKEFSDYGLGKKVPEMYNSYSTWSLIQKNKHRFIFPIYGYLYKLSVRVQTYGLV